ncbi:MAG: glucose 1-dehydrogenase [Acidobacteria bacterium]|nr:glucose 1-dehydrogenase [Acidobacteriota bacterium]
MGPELEGKVIFVTGAADGIGLECASAYVREGARVVIADCQGGEAIRAAGQLGEAALGVSCDVSRGSDVEAAIHATLEHFGRLDAVHNNAGVASPSKPLHLTTEQEWDRLLEVNLKSVYWTTRYAHGELVRTRGAILNTASMVGLIGQSDHAAYVAAKGGMIALTKAMALDYALAGVRVNAICPAAVFTPMLARWCEEQRDPQSMRDYLAQIHALGYCPEPGVVADAAVFLLSDRARFITGCAMPVSGGAELGYRR